jgi:hypothetical protein
VTGDVTSNVVADTQGERLIVRVVWIVLVGEERKVAKIITE